MAAIRAAGEQDLEAVCAIYGHAVTHGAASYEYDPPPLAEMLSRFRALRLEGFPYLVAQQDGRVLGYAYAGPFRPRAAYRFSVEDSIYIAPNAQGRGLGKRLLHRLIEDCAALGFRQMIAVIGDGGVNLASVRLHAALGFAECGRIAHSGYKFGRWCDTVLMQRYLGDASASPPGEPRLSPQASR